MFSKQEYPNMKKDGISKITLNYTATVLKPAVDSLSEMDVAIIPEDVFKRVGYTNSRNETVLCCDAQSIKNGKCSNQGHIMIPKEDAKKCAVKSVSLKDHENKGSLSFDVQTTGIHYIIAVTCDNRIGVVRFEGDYDVVNPFGKLPAQTYGLLPFTGMLFLVYAVLLFWWLFMCIKYAKELMSVHIIVLTILGCFVLDMGVKLIYLTVYNRVGHPVFFLAILSIVIDCSTRTLTRILTLFVCMGLGVTKATLDDTLITCEFIVFGIVYYVITFGDSYLTVYPTSNHVVEVVRFALTSSIDAIVYFWIFVSLMDTMDTLVEKKQERKLQIYKKLRLLFIVSVILATVTLVGFSYIVLNDLSSHMWKYQWFINDGIWGLFYVILFVAIMIMWLPSENTSAYAYHMEISTSDQPTTDGYEQPSNSLVDMDGEESHFEVAEVSSEMKPMDYVELVPKE
ncbi:hypothetical protein WA588_001117 [Blastocystis sp. NMH]